MPSHCDSNAHPILCACRWLEAKRLPHIQHQNSVATGFNFHSSNLQFHIYYCDNRELFQKSYRHLTVLSTTMAKMGLSCNFKFPRPWSFQVPNGLPLLRTRLQTLESELGILALQQDFHTSTPPIVSTVSLVVP